LTTWAITTLVVFWLVTTTVSGILGSAFSGLGSMIGGTANTIGSAAQTAAQVAAPEAMRGSNPFGQIEQSIRQATGGNDPAALRDAAIAAVRAAVTSNEQQAQEARERASQALAQARNIPIEEARTQVQQYEQQYRQAVATAKQQATNIADTTASSVATGALLGSVALLLGAIAGWFGRRMGAVDPTVTAAQLRSLGRAAMSRATNR
jgi:membrane glycosyltransferase